MILCQEPISIYFMDILNIELETTRILIANLNAYMDLHDLKVADFAIKCETSPQQVYMVIGGKTTPKIDFLDRLAKGMGITVSQLLTEGYFDQFEKKIVKKKS